MGSSHDKIRKSGAIRLAKHLSLQEWLVANGWEKYANSFLTNDVDVETLGHLTDQDLRELGVNSIGHRRKMMATIPAFLKESLRNQTSPDDKDSVELAVISQRRQTTMMFSDLVGFTKMIARLDPELVRDVLGEYKEICAEVINRNGGHVMQFLGDGVLATFGYPRALGDDSARAVRAALELVEVVAHLKTSDGESLSARVGMATGVVVTGDLAGENASENEMLVGEAPNLAARLQSEAAPGEVYISESTAKLIGRQFVLKSAGKRYLKGFEDKLNVYRVLSENRIESRFHARLRVVNLPLVDRAEEMSRLRQSLKDACSGRGTIATIVGEAGIGKSRLVAELIREAEPLNMSRLLLQTSASNTGTPFYAFVKNIEYAADIQPNESNDTRLSKLSDFLQRNIKLTDLELALIAQLVGVETVHQGELHGFSPREIRTRVMATLLKLLMAVASKGLLIIVEDYQWIDPSSRELLGSFKDSFENTRSLMILTMRSGARIDEKLKYGNMVECHLDRLTPTQVRELITNIVAENKISAEVLDTMVRRSDGVPIFAEELAYAVRDRNEKLKRERIISTELKSDTVPSTLTESLLARLDLLSHGQEIVQYASAVGTEIQIKFLQEIAPHPPEIVTAGVDELVAARILVRQQTRAGETVVFRQTMVRDCAYGLILRRDKIRIHQRIAEVAVQKFPIIAKLRLDFVPTQWELAGQIDQAIEAWRTAGINANAAAAVSEAVSHFSRALDLCLSLKESAERDELELSIRTEIAFPMLALQSYSGSNLAEHIDRATDLSRKVSATHRLVPLLMARFLMTLVVSTVDEGRKIAEETVVAARDGGDVEQLLVARVQSTIALFQGQLLESVDHLDAFTKLYDPTRHDSELMKRGATHHAVTIQVGYATAYALMGKTQKAREHAERAIKAARETQHLNTICQTLVAAGGFCAALEKDTEALQKYGEELESITTEYNMPIWSHHASLFKGLSLHLRGECSDGLRLARRGIDGIVAVGSIAKTAWFMFYAAACIDSKDCDEARRALILAEDPIATGERWFEAEHARLSALLAAEDGAEQIEIIRQLEYASAIVKKQHAYLFESRIQGDTTSLAA